MKKGINNLLALLSITLFIISLFAIKNISEQKTYLEDVTGFIGSVGVCVGGLTLTSIGSLSAVKDVQFNYDVDSSEEGRGNITYSDNTTLFDINSVNGTINFTPTTTGDFNINISVDLYDGSCTWSASEVITMSITEKTTTTTTTGGGGGGGGRTTTQLVALDIIQPSPVSLYSNDTIITPLFIHNKGDVALNGISLKAISDTPNLLLTLSKDYINRLEINETVTTDLIIKSVGDIGVGQHEVNVIADVINPPMRDTIKFFVNLLEFGLGERTVVEEKLVIVNELIEGNPECLELRELITQAEESLKKKEYEKALDLTEAAINGCKNLVALKGKIIEVPKKGFKTNELVIVVVESLLALLVLGVLYRYYKRRKVRKKKR